MKVAVVGSRSLKIEHIEDYLPPQTTHIISGGAKGVDRCAAEYARSHGIPLTEILPDYHRYGKGAPLRRNSQIVELADLTVIFWDGVSSGSRSIMEICKKMHRPFLVYLMKSKNAIKFGLK